ncbi:unnamed protein product (macronuclear) [Paramecium tetraurelia]|uniref:3-hydroxyisobutyryl-CoA hydrolase n=1 Tax=Paramecium tetraurelia TaxID=5888 RepID=A0CRF3_PARTE|nr:uncharacterized protein GSPATT00009685001 [Paramecium tetraurelia]CAK73370.1 unnamed protein product [Paramecium tetraurelia]|eukprot:XP_001440767.1 hypothetical protein (macronuclear) [Paramecium tetraurelia strain d4-2]
MRHIAKNNCIINKIKDGLSTTYFNRLDKLNAVNLEMCEDILESSKFWNEHAVVTILKGVGNTFASGADYEHILNVPQNTNDLSNLSTNGQLRDVSKFSLFGDQQKKAVHAIGSNKSITISIMNGPTSGIGAAFGINSRLKIATENTTFVMPHCKLGMVPDGGSALKFSKIYKNYGMYLGMSGEQLDGLKMAHLGIADYLIDSECIPEIEMEIEQAHYLRDEESIKEFLLQRYCYLNQTEFEVPKQFLNVLSLSSLPSIMSAMEAQFPEQAAQIRKNSAFSVYAFYELFMRNKKAKLSLKDNLKMEQSILDKVAARPDFVEGLRSLLVDTSYEPKFNPKTIEQVDLEEIQRCFEPCSRKLFDD